EARVDQRLRLEIASDAVRGVGENLRRERHARGTAEPDDALDQPLALDEHEDDEDDDEADGGEHARDRRERRAKRVESTRRRLLDDDRLRRFLRGDRAVLLQLADDLLYGRLRLLQRIGFAGTPCFADYAGEVVLVLR